MSSISQFFKNNDRKKNRKIFAGTQTTTWQVPSNASELEVHVWGGGGNGRAAGGAGGTGQERLGGGGGGYSSHTFVVTDVDSLSITIGSNPNAQEDSGGTSTVVVTQPIGTSTLTSTGGKNGQHPSPGTSAGGSGSISLAGGVPADSSFTACGGISRFAITAPLASTGASGGGGAGFIYGPGGRGGQKPNALYPGCPNSAGAGGGGIKGDGGGTTSAGPQSGGGGGGGFMSASTSAGAPGAGVPGSFAIGGAGVSGQVQNSMGNASAKEWFYLDEVDGVGGSSGAVADDGFNPSIFIKESAFPGFAGGGGGGMPSTVTCNLSGMGPLAAGNGGIFGGGGGGNGSFGITGGAGGYAGGGGGGYASSVDGNTLVSGKGGEGIVILYW
jgi:hypothetical protein